MFGLDLGLTILLIFCLLAACAFEFINGFHDTANAVATVIYTHSLKPNVAVIWSGIFNFFGVILGGIAVAMGIVNMLPLDALIDQNIYHGVAMILAIILTAIIWNLGTWYYGIPCSSSHTLIGSIFGVGLAYSLIPGVGHVALNWAKIGDMGLSLLISPIFGFGMAMLLMVIIRKFVHKKKLFREPGEKKAPPFWIRGILILTSASVSFAHGSNDGQKGVGLIMIILILLFCPERDQFVKAGIVTHCLSFARSSPSFTPSSNPSSRPSCNDASRQVSQGFTATVTPPAIRRLLSTSYTSMG